MSIIEEKYRRNRHLIKDGDLILFHGNGFVATVIRSSDKEPDGSWAKHSHIGIVFEKHGALFILDANANGVQADRLSWRVRKYHKDGDFTVIHPLATEEKVGEEMSKLLSRSDSKWIKYDIKNGLKELCNRRFGWNLKTSLRSEHFICSTNDAEYAANLNMVTDEFKNKTIVFPQDYIRYRSTYNTMIVC